MLWEERLGSAILEQWRLVTVDGGCRMVADVSNIGSVWVLKRGDFNDNSSRKKMAAS